MSGIPSGETARIRDDDGHVLLSYRGFASAIGVVAALVAGIVLLAGIAACLFLALEKHPATSVAAFALSVVFSIVIAMLVPPLSVTLFNDSSPMLTISQISRLNVPAVTYAVVTPEGKTLAHIRKRFFSRLARNRWVAYRPSDHETLVEAVEESFGRALLRKFFGKFHRDFEANMHLRRYGRIVGEIVRRPAGDGSIDTLDLSRDREETVDRRVAVALATLVLGGEP